ncbi:MAG TPA: ATP phosphoribosyltransferase regulatory subunit [Nitrospira sp.]|jgi:ATP phosphoribosyltransferase regulatory subunit|nr:ATP phosphoribosyltransferase regulatory subunit [Nitrospira sp.]
MTTAPPKPRAVPEHVLSSRERSLVPVGMATILPHAAYQVRRIESRLLEQVSRWGYDEIILPTFEYLDVLAPGLEAELLETCYQFIDRTTGRTLLLRPDATAQVARTIGMGLTGDAVPQRLSYRTSVFRYEPEHAGRGREIFQVGAELVGVDDVTGDYEIISLLIECLQAIGLRAFTIALGHVGFIKGLLARSGLSPQGQKRAEQAAARKDLPRLEELLAAERIAKTTAKAIREAPELTGQEQVLDRGRALASGDPALMAPLDRLAQLYQLLCAAGHRDALLLDLGEFRGFEYYDGVVFDVFASGVGAELGGGGRYDHLIGRFGRNLPSTGFALDVDHLFRAVEIPQAGGSAPRLDYVVAGPRRSARVVIELAKMLRHGRCRVAQLIVKGGEQTIVSNALAAAQAQGAEALVVVGAPGVDQKHVALFERIAPDARRNGRPHRPLMKKLSREALLASGRSRQRRGAAT